LATCLQQQKKYQELQGNFAESLTVGCAKKTVFIHNFVLIHTILYNKAFHNTQIRNVKVSRRISSYEWCCTEIIAKPNNIILILMHGKQCEKLQKVKDVTLQSVGDITHKDQFTLYVMT
jgi:hypothetical protein